MAEKKAAKAKVVPAKKSIKPTAPKVAKKASKTTAISRAVETPKAEEPTVKVRKPRKAKVGSFAELVKKQAEIEAIKKRAKTELKELYEDKLKEADAIKRQYSELFREQIESAPANKRGRKAAAKASGGKPQVRSRGFTVEQVESFIQQKESGLNVAKIKVAGKNITGVKRIDAAYEKADEKDAESVFQSLK
jgi:hypothetical protein